MQTSAGRPFANPGNDVGRERRSDDLQLTVGRSEQPLEHSQGQFIRLIDRGHSQDSNTRHRACRAIAYRVCGSGFPSWRLSHCLEPSQASPLCGADVGDFPPNVGAVPGQIMRQGCDLMGENPRDPPRN